jgi:Predicted O-methyltransferase
MAGNHESERIDYLFNTDLKIIQSEDLFPFSLDSVLLARFAYVPVQHGRLADLCSGNGVIPFLLSRRTRGKITGIEVQPEVCRLAERGAALNKLDKQVDFICDEAQKLPGLIGAFHCDVVTCNPPYFTRSAARDLKINRHLAIARHELLITLDEVVGTAANLLRQGGKFAMVHRPERLNEIMAAMSRKGIEPKRIQFVHPRIDKPANMVLIEGSNGGHPGLRVLPPIAVYGADGKYTKDVWPE